MGPRHVQVDNLDKVPQGSAQRDTNSWARPHTFIDWRGQGVLCLFLFALILFVAFRYDSGILFWISYGGGWWMPYVVVGVVFLFLLKRWALEEQPGGYKVVWFGLNGRAVIDGMLKVQQAEAKRQFPHAAQITLTNTQLAPAPEADIEEAEIIDAGPVLIPDQEWLAWIDRTPHLLLAGRTDAGKTTFAEAILAERIHAGDQIVICDPHYQPGKWHGIEATAQIDAILALLSRLEAELSTRFDAFNAGKPTDDFQRLTILLDEVPAIIEETFRLTPAGTKKIIDDRWSRFARRLGSQARKVRISVVLLSQTIFVEDLMINSAYRENFVRVGLGDKARPLLAEEKRNETKQALYELLRGQTHPAAFEHNGEIHLLDTSRVPALASRRIGHMAQLWMPPAQIAPRPVVSAYQQDATLRATAQVQNASVSPVSRAPLRSATPVASLNEQQRDALVQALRRRKWTQDAIRDELRKGGVAIAQDRLVALCQEVDRWDNATKTL